MIKSICAGLLCSVALSSLALAQSAPVISTISAAGASSSFYPQSQRVSNIQISGTAQAKCFLERQLDGINWFPISISSAGSTTMMYQYSYVGNPTSEQFLETQDSIAYRLDCGAQLGSFTSGTLTVRFSQ